MSGAEKQEAAEHVRQESQDDSSTTTNDEPSKEVTDGTETAQKAPWRSLFFFTTRSNVPLLLAAITISIIAGAASPAQNLLIGELYQGFTDFAAGKLERDQFLRQETRLVLYQVAVAGGSWIFHSLEFMAWLAFGELQAKSARDRLFHGLLEKEIEWYDRRKNGIGALLPRLQAQIRELQLATAQPMGEFFSLLSTAILSLLQAFLRSWDLTLVTVSTVPLMLIVIGACGRPMQRNLGKQQDKLTEAQKYSTSALSAIETVKCFNGQEIEVEKYRKTIDEAARWYGWVANASAVQMGLLGLFTLSLFVQGFYYGGTLVAKGKLESGDVVTCFFSAVGAFQSVSAILPQMIVFEKGKVAGSTLRAIMAQIEGGSKINKTEGLAPATCRGDIDVEGLSFAYPSRPDQLAIRNVTLYIQGGDMTFLIGKSGSGKSTISQLLMRFYNAEEGVIKVDGIPLASLDTTWLRSNITLVEQTSMLFNDTIFNNVAFGRKDYSQVTKEEVAEAIEFALLQLTITDLPDGLDTQVGFKGGSLSGGQRQRMALARARIRDTPVLILDESTSALDHISRTLMMEAIRRWRQGKTTIIITHDISQILADDYIYLLENGQLVQEGHRKHLEGMKGTPFQAFLSEEQQAAATRYEESIYSAPDSVDSPHTSMNSFAQIMRPAPSDYEHDPLERYLSNSEKVKKDNRTSYFPDVISQGSPLVGMRSYGKSGWMKMAYSPGIGQLSINTDVASTKSPTTPSPSQDESPVLGKRWTQVWRDLVDQTGNMAAEARKRTTWTPARRDLRTDSMAIPLTDRSGSPSKLEANQPKDDKPVQMNELKYIFGTIMPNLDWRGKLYLYIGFWGATGHAVVTPAFSYILAKLLGTYSAPGGDKKKALMYSMTILGISFADAIHTWIFRFFHEYVSQIWVDRIRCKAYARILDQSRDFFEKEENGVSRLTENLDRNAEEMRNLLGRFASLAFVAVLTILISVIWAMVSQWKMTLIALAVAPYVYGVTTAFARISEKWEGRSNDAAEGASAIFTETFNNIKTVRALTLEPHFVDKYVAATNHTLKVGYQRSFYAGFFYGLSDSAGNFSTALIFYVGTKLILEGAKVTDIVSVLTMLIFTIGNVSNILNFIPQMGSSKDTAGRLLKTAALPRDSHEHLGDTRITNVGEIIFDNLRFNYPSRPEQTVLKDISLHIRPGTATAIVGGSGSGKSTIANLLLDLYSTATMPDGGKVGDLTFGGRDMKHIYTPSLRALIVPVSQTPTLFAATIAENISYGLPSTPQSEIETAAQQAGIHTFILSLPLGYSTLVGEGGMGLSGGQSQRLAIARALVRKPAVLILDEATSALDVESANLVRETLHNLIYDKNRAMTVIVITHHRDMMEICERIVLLDHGKIVEEGAFGELMEKGGALANLMGGGEWDANAKKKKSRGKRGNGVPVLKEVDWSRKKGKNKSRTRPSPGGVRKE